MFISCSTCSPPSVHPPNKEHEFLGFIVTLHLAPVLAGPVKWINGNTQQRDFSPAVSGSTETAMSVFIRNEWEMTFPRCTLQC